MFKSYSSKKSALKGAERAGVNLDAVREEDGKWGFDVQVEGEQGTATDTGATDTGAPTDPLAAVPNPGKSEDEPKRKIQKDRPMQNGVKMPSEGGMCRAVWDFCSAHQTEKGDAPGASDVKKEAEVRGWNVNNASIEYYQWRKFHGIRGRQAKAKVEAGAPAAQ